MPCQALALAHPLTPVCEAPALALHPATHSGLQTAAATALNSHLACLQAPGQVPGQSESQGYPGFQPPQAFPGQHYPPQLQPSLGADMIVPRGQQQQQQQPQPPQAQQLPPQQQAQPPREGMSQRGSATSLQDLRQSAAALGEGEACHRTPAQCDITRAAPDLAQLTTECPRAYQQRRGLAMHHHSAPTEQAGQPSLTETCPSGCTWPQRFKASRGAAGVLVAAVQSSTALRALS